MIQNIKLARACGVPVGRRSGGRLATTLVATISIVIFFQAVSNQKTYFVKVDHRPFWGPLGAIFYLAGCAGLQAVSKCPWRR